MKHQDYCCDDSTRQAYEQYYTSQAENGLPEFQGLRYQRGHSLGSLFRGLIGVAIEERCHCTGKEKLGTESSQSRCGITWEIIKGTVTKESVSFH